MVVIDVSFDRRFKLVCDDNHKNPRYEEHDGTELEWSEEVASFSVKSHHLDAVQIRDHSMSKMGILPFQAPSSKIWQRLTNKSAAFPFFTYPTQQRVAAVA